LATLGDGATTTAVEPAPVIVTPAPAEQPARVVSDMLVAAFPDILEVGFTAQLEENLEVLGVQLTLAPDARAVRSAVAHANGRAVIIDAGCGTPTEAAAAKQIRALTEAAQAEPALVLSAESPNDQAIALARAASRIGTRRLILTRLDTSRYLGTPLHAADEGQLALVAASVTPHFAFGLRVLAPENLARRILSAALRAERWRVAPF